LPAALLKPNRNTATSMNRMPASAAERPAEVVAVGGVVISVPAGTGKLTHIAEKWIPLSGGYAQM